MRKLILLVAVGVVLSGCAWSPFLAGWDEPVVETAAGDAAHGEAIYKQGEDGAPPCSSCHALAEGTFSLGPSLHGIGDRAGSRIEGLNAEAYIRQSILEPDAYLVNGYRSMMYPKYGEHFDDQDLADLLAYLGSL